jgi:hypothetical protein
VTSININYLHIANLSFVLFHMTILTICIFNNIDLIHVSGLEIIIRKILSTIHLQIDVKKYA